MREIVLKYILIYDELYIDIVQYIDYRVIYLWRNKQSSRSKKQFRRRYFRKHIRVICRKNWFLALEFCLFRPRDAYIQYSPRADALIFPRFPPLARSLTNAGGMAKFIRK